MRLPSGERYWTVLGTGLRPVVEADEFLRHVRFARDGAENTTHTYAGALVLFWRWCEVTGRPWTLAAGHLGMFIAVWRETGLGAPADLDTLHRQITSLQQEVTELRRQLTERTEELEAARAASRELMAQLNRPKPS